MKAEVNIYHKIDKTNYKNLVFLLFINVLTFSTETYYFTLQTFY